MLTASDVRQAPRTARYRLRKDGCNTGYPGARFKDGVATKPATARTALRLRAAFGAALVIEPWDVPEPARPEPRPAKTETPKGDSLPSGVAAAARFTTKKKKTTKTRETKRQDHD